MKNEKYTLTDEFIIVDNIKLYRIQSMSYFSDVKKGDLGGFIQSKNNLSENGDCWIYDNAKAYNNARVLDNVKMYNNSSAYDNAMLFGNSIMRDDSIARDDAKIYDDAQIGNNVIVCNNGEVMRDFYICKRDAIIYCNILNIGYKSVGF